jgi:serine/threonine-protein kinase HipA
VAFNISVGNSDDHFRNHGFLLTPEGGHYHLLTI